VTPTRKKKNAPSAPEQARGDAELRRVNRALRTLSACSKALMRSVTEKALLEEICRVIVTEGGYRMVWTGYAEDDQHKTVRPLASAGYEAGYLEKLSLTWADTERGRGPTGIAIRTGRPQVCQNFLGDPNLAPWHDEARARDYASCISLPLIAGGRAFGVLNIYASEPDAFDGEELELLTELAGELAFGIGVLRQRAEGAQVEALFNSLASTIPDRIYFKDRKSRFVRINASMAKRFGMSGPDEAVGKTDFDVHSVEHARQAFADEQRIMETGVPIIDQEEMETWPDGRVTWASSTKMPLRDPEGRITGLVGISHDVTERKLSDARLREQNEILTNSNEGVMIVNLQNQVTLWNRGAERLFGWTAAEALGCPPRQLLPIDDPAAFFERRTLIEREGYWHGELQTQTRDGRKLTVDCHTALVRDEAGQPRARISFFADVTEMKLLEEKLLRAQQLENIGMLAAGIAHDLNNVLTPILGIATLLRPRLSVPRDLKMLDTLEENARRGAGLAKQILGFVRTTTGELQTTQVKTIAYDIVHVVEETFPKSIELEHDIGSDLWPVLGNATQIHQVLLNLCINARDAMPKGGTLQIIAANRRLDVEEAAAIPAARPGNWLMLEVSDTGTGIAPEVLKSIWLPFFTTKGEGRGTGLGLSTIRGIVANHGGFIELQTEVGRGSVFRVFLPAVEGEVSPPGGALPSSIPRGRGELILVVDDEASIRDIVTAVLQKHGYSVLSCSDGMEAITLFKVHPDEIALVVTDVDMPNLNGVGLAKTLLRIRPDIHLIVMSGLPRSDTTSSDVTMARELAHIFLSKPFHPGDLLGAVHSLLHPEEKA
jgi:PAS domain S-box-containing protein